MKEPTIAIPKSEYEELKRKAQAYDNMTKHLSSAGKAAANKLTPEQRSARAKKAVAARIVKYGQKAKNA